MKTSIFSFVLLCLCLLLSFEITTRAVDSGPSANGDFRFVLEDGNVRYLEFAARIHPNGPRGRMTFSDPSTFFPAEGDENTVTGVQMTAEFDCAKIEANRAVMGGVITSSNVLSAIGRRVLLVVEDNGEGVNAPQPDRLTWGVYASTAPTWIPKDAERDDDIGATLTWLATDAERPDDVGIPSNQSSVVGCGTFPLSSYAFTNVGHGNGNIQVRP